MFSIDSNWALLVAGALKIFVISVMAAILVAVARRLTRRIITMKIPKVREELPNQLADRSRTLSRIATQFVAVVIWILAFLMILDVLGINIAPILATVGVASLAVGFAAQNIIRDYLHGFFIVMEDWYRVGEVAVISGTGGLVENISLRRTVLRDLSGTVHIFPNSKVESASNLTRDWARINLNVGVAYKENLDHVIDVTNKVCQEFKNDPVWGKDLLNMPHVERVDNLGDNGIEIKILGDTRPMRQWALTGELRKRLKARFDEEDIEIPWPHTKLYFGDTLQTGVTGRQ
jgi:small conductance mechanosensitive channel